MLTALLILLMVGVVTALAFSLNALFTLARVRVPFVTVPNWVIGWLQTNLELKPGQTFVELGCGDGRVLKALAQEFHRSTFIGYELSWWPYLLARLSTWKHKNTTILRQDFFQASWQSADVLFCYLLTGVMPRVKKKIDTDAKPGSTLFSYGFDLPDAQPVASYLEPGKTKGPRLWQYQAEP